MNRTYINVPYKDNRMAKALGAVWDPVRRCAYVPEGVNLSKFAAWPLAPLQPPQTVSAASSTSSGSAAVPVPATAIAPPAPSVASAAARTLTVYSPPPKSKYARHRSPSSAAVPAKPVEPIKRPMAWPPATVVDKPAVRTTQSAPQSPRPPASAVAPIIAKAAAPAATPGHSAPSQAPTQATTQKQTPAPSAGTTPHGKFSISLSQLLGGVASAIADVYKSGVWTTVEVTGVNTRSGHVYLELSERDSTGAQTAKVSGTIWASTAKKIVPEFERATGVNLAAGIKLLVRARPIYKPQFNLTIDIDAIDPGYTLGDLEARKRDIRSRLQAEGVFEAQKKLPIPWDYNQVLVIAPDGAAGLGDFQAESRRLSTHGLCDFVYVHSRFQGEGAAGEMARVLQEALAQWVAQRKSRPDAVVIIRGGGAVNDLSWLNDYALAKAICTLPIPVLTGIGHERDSTLLDEVAHTRYDTPSKVVTGIEQVIVKRTREARDAFEMVTRFALLSTQKVRSSTQLMDKDVRSGAGRQVDLAKRKTKEQLTAIEDGARRVVTNAKTGSKTGVDFVIERAVSHTLRVRVQVDAVFQTMNQSAHQVVHEAQGRVKGLIREITGQGPEKTLVRGFSVVRDSGGKTVTRASQVEPGQTLSVQFSDGSVAAHADGEQA